MSEPFAHHRDVQRLIEALRESGGPDDSAGHGHESSIERPDLTPRQWEILHGVAAGATNLQIGHRLGVSEATVRKHLEHVFERLRVSSRTEAVMAVSAHLDPARPWDEPAQAQPSERPGDASPEVPPERV
jgi:DNA-binding NarL/FixJ family response regulator